jgi:flagellar hook assembly protein FlgD
VDTLSFKNQKQGLNSVTWNCPSSAKGAYTFAVSALDKSGKAVSASTMAQGTVTGVNFHDGATYLSVSGQEVGFSDVVSVK